MIRSSINGMGQALNDCLHLIRISEWILSSFLKISDVHRLIIQLANNLIKHNQTRTSGKMPLVAHKPAGESTVLKARIFKDELAEMSAISKAIKDAGWNAEDCAVLARSTKLLEKAAIELCNDGFLPYLAQRKNEFESASVRWMHAALRLANARHDREFLRRLCVAWDAFTGVVIEAKDVEALAVFNGGDFLRAWVSALMKSAHQMNFVSFLTELIAELVDQLLFIELIEWFWSKNWLNEPIEEEEIKTWQDLHGALMREHSPENVTLNLYLQEMDLKSKAPARMPGSIPCLTVHGAKGLEFKHVFLIGMADGVFPSYQAVKKGPNVGRWKKSDGTALSPLLVFRKHFILVWPEPTMDIRKNLHDLWRKWVSNLENHDSI